MNSKPGLTLNDIRKSPKLAKVSRVSDFLTKEEQNEVRLANVVGKHGEERKFDTVDAYCAEIIARFGYDAYKAWNCGELDSELVARMIAAERARKRAAWLPIEAIVINMVGSCIKRQKGEPAPKGPKAAQKIMKIEVKAARGEK